MKFPKTFEAGRHYETFFPRNRSHCGSAVPYYRTVIAAYFGFRENTLTAVKMTLTEGDWLDPESCCLSRQHFCATFGE
jgi:hypothetical protein